jgi:two-component system chemotaxis response regulator CheY
MAKILIVDDSGLSRRIMRGILELAGHQVCEASDGLAALERYFLDRPDLVLLDLMMSGLSGLEVLAQLHELDANARVVVATADIQTSTGLLTRAAGAHSVITKPFVPEQVLDAVDVALRAPQQREQGDPQ